MRTAVQTEPLVVTWTPDGFDPVTFKLAPPDGLMWLRFAARQPAGGGENDPPEARIEREVLAIAEMVREWSGVDAVSGGVAKPAPTNPPPEMVAQYLRQNWHLGVLVKIGEAIAASLQRGADAGKVSGSGSSSAPPAPSSTAESTWTETVPPSVAVL